MRTPKKAELYEKIEALERENLRLQEENEAEKQRRWQEKIPRAQEVIRAELGMRFGYAVRLLKFEHVDGAGYWFSLELAQDKTRQTWCVRHEEL